MAGVVMISFMSNRTQSSGVENAKVARFPGSDYIATEYRITQYNMIRYYGSEESSPSSHRGSDICS